MGYRIVVIVTIKSMQQKKRFFYIGVEYKAVGPDGKSFLGKLVSRNKGTKRARLRVAYGAKKGKVVTVEEKDVTQRSVRFN